MVGSSVNDEAIFNLTHAEQVGTLAGVDAFGVGQEGFGCDQ